MANKTSPLKQVDPFNAGINNYDQTNIDQNQALAFNQQFRVGNWDAGGSGPQGGKYDRGAMNAAGVNPFGTANANTSQNKITGATTMNNNSFQATTIPNTIASQNTGVDQLSLGQLSTRGEGMDTKGNPQSKPVNTFSSDIDPTNKTDFKNEVINNVMASDTLANLSEPIAAPQNKLEELYKLS